MVITNRRSIIISNLAFIALKRMAKIASMKALTSCVTAIKPRKHQNGLTHGFTSRRPHLSTTKHISVIPKSIALFDWSTYEIIECRGKFDNSFDRRDSQPYTEHAVEGTRDIRRHKGWMQVKKDYRLWYVSITREFTIDSGVWLKVPESTIGLLQARKSPL